MKHECDTEFDKYYMNMRVSTKINMQNINSNALDAYKWVCVYNTYNNSVYEE